jgi:hypothetical protein
VVSKEERVRDAYRDNLRFFRGIDQQRRIFIRRQIFIVPQKSGTDAGVEHILDDAYCRTVSLSAVSV